MILISLSLKLEILLLPPLLTAALALSLMSTAQTRAVGGVVLLLATLVAPPLVFLGRRPAADGEQILLQNPVDPLRKDGDASDRGRYSQAGARPAPTVSDGTQPRPTAGDSPYVQPGPRPLPRRADPVAARVAAPAQPQPASRSASPPSLPAPGPNAPIELPAVAKELIQGGAAGAGQTPGSQASPATGAPEDWEGDQWDRLDPFPRAGVRAVGAVLDEAAQQAAATNRGVWVDGADMWTDETNMHGTGAVQNNGTNSVGSVPVLVLWFDANTNIIATSRAVIGMSDALDPGEKKSFGIQTPGDPRIVGYHYIPIP